MLAGLVVAVNNSCSAAWRAVLRHGWLAWLVWLVVGFVLFNSGAPHAVIASRAPRSTLMSLRAHFTDDADVARYLAYVRAALGRPYIGHYVRTLEEWRQFQDTIDDAPDPLDEPLRSSPPLVPYRDYLVEYPPGFFVVALLPAVLTGDIDLFRILFGSWMALLLSVALWMCARMTTELERERERERGVAVAGPLGVSSSTALCAWSAAALLAIGVVAVHRYDAAVSVAICATYWACIRRRWLLAGAALGFAVAAKGVPLLLAPLAAIYLLHVGGRRSRLVELGAFVAGGALVLVIIVLPAQWFAGGHLLDILRYQTERPIQVESTPGAVMSLLHAFDPDAFSAVKSYGSTNVIGPHAALASVIGLGLAALGGLGICVQLWRRLRSGKQPAATALAAAFCGLLVLYMVSGRVFSPQYLVWLLPLGGLVSLACGRLATVSLLLTFLLTQLIYPVFYDQVSHLEPWGSALVLARNLLLAYWGWTVVVSGPGRSARQPPDAATVTYECS